MAATLLVTPQTLQPIPIPVPREVYKELPVRPKRPLPPPQIVPSLQSRTPVPSCSFLKTAPPPPPTEIPSHSFSWLTLPLSPHPLRFLGHLRSSAAPKVEVSHPHGAVPHCLVASILRYTEKICKFLSPSWPLLSCNPRSHFQLATGHFHNGGPVAPRSLHTPPTSS